MTSIQMPNVDVGAVERRMAIAADLQKIAGREAVIADETGRRAFETDALTAYKSLPLLVVMPGSTEMVSRVLKYCHANRIKVVARGAGTSLCGGSLPTEDAIVLCMSKMARLLDVDYANRIARVETGITNLAISNAVKDKGFFYAPDPSSQLACSIGGNLAMNSGGAHCLKYGVTTHNVLGVRVVLIDGSIVDVGGGQLDPSGYDFLSLLIGSEGQLGVMTEATVRILPCPEGARPMLIGFDSPEAAGRCVAAIIAAGIIPVATEYMDRPAIAVCEAHAKAGYPLNVEALLIVEVEGSDGEIAALLKRIETIASSNGAKTTEISADGDHSARIWAGRKSAFGAIGRLADYYCMDGTIPLSQLPAVLTKISEICARHGLKVANIFHAGDGNLHPLILYDANSKDQAAKAELAGAEILTLCVEVGGCLTGEHGVGIEKRDLMTVQFSATDIAVQMRVKSVFDPDWLLNPAKVFPLDASKPMREGFTVSRQDAA
jgi:glycolate oxidase